MTNIRLKYLQSFTDRFGHVRFYFRYRGNRWPLPAPHEAGFAVRYDALLTEIKANPLAMKNVHFMRGSLGWVINQFIISPAFEGRAEATKRNYRRVIGALKERYGAGQMKDLQPRHVKTMRN
jgi:hypothetical protein